MKQKRLKLYMASIFATAMLFFSFSSQAAMTYQSTTAADEQNVEREIEIITVTGSQPLHFFRAQLETAEDDFYAALNELMDDDSYKIDCKIKKNTFSSITDRRVCEPKYVSEIKFEMTQLALKGRAQLDKNLYKLPSRALLANAFEAKRKKHLAAVRNQVENNPELQLKLLNLNKAKYSFNKKHLEEFGDLSGADTEEVVSNTKEFVNPEQ